ncbi:hypothetical protein V8F06_001066, partial [Rhypophila decipiens]
MVVMVMVMMGSLAMLKRSWSGIPLSSRQKAPVRMCSVWLIPARCRRDLVNRSWKRKSLQAQLQSSLNPRISFLRALHCFFLIYFPFF